LRGRRRGWRRGRGGGCGRRRRRRGGRCGRRSRGVAVGFGVGTGDQCREHTQEHSSRVASDGHASFTLFNSSASDRIARRFQDLMRSILRRPTLWLLVVFLLGAGAYAIVRARGPQVRVAQGRSEGHRTAHRRERPRLGADTRAGVGADAGARAGRQRTRGKQRQSRRPPPSARRRRGWALDVARAQKTAAEAQQVSSGPAGSDTRIALTALFQAQSQLAGANARLAQTKIFALTTVLATAVGIVSALIPARRASRLDPALAIHDG